MIVLCALAAIALLGALWAPSAAQAAFGLADLDVSYENSAGEAELRAGAHPYAMKVSFEPETKKGARLGLFLLDEMPKTIQFGQIPGLVGNPTAVPRCSTADFLTTEAVKFTSGDIANLPACPDATAAGIVLVETLINEKRGITVFSSVYNLEPAPGQAARLGFWAAGVPVTVAAGVNPDPPHNIVATVANISQIVEIRSTEFTLWGTPADPAHDEYRGHCLRGEAVREAGAWQPVSDGLCDASLSLTPFLTMPRACGAPLETSWRAESWQSPGKWVEGSVETHDALGNPRGMSGCGELDFIPEVGVRPSSTQAESSAGLEVAIDVADEGIGNPHGRAAADISATELRLPAGMTVNPSAAEGLGVCTSEQFDDASLTNRGCPQASKLGTLEVDTPILENHTLHGSFYLAEQYRNPFGSLLAAYLTITDAELGVFVKLPARIETDPESGQILTTVRDMPPFPLERVRVNLRSGPRAPLITPPACGAYESEIKLTPSSGAAAQETTSAFTIDSGPGGQPCPSANLPFAPGFQAGTQNNAAASYSPFSMRLTRSDGMQDLTKFSATLPPGVTARLAGVQKCSEAALAGASSRTGRAEQASPSCPAGSQVGRVVAGAGVGTALTYVEGSLYLSGPYNGAPLSVAAIVPAVAGPFDVGTVLTRVGLQINPVTGQGEVDGAASDPIPHILAGIPLKVRDIRVLADRPDFTLNPTSCRESQTEASIWGGGRDFLSAADDSPVAATSRYQASSCASLAFKPRLAIRLYGGTRRGAFPALRAIVRPRPGEANFARAAVTLPRSAFLEQGHIRTICTRVQFAAGAGHGSQCPAGAVYGHAKAWSPLLEDPATGPVYLRSSNHNLPDLVVALKGPDSAPVDVELASRIDSVKGGIRSIFTAVPDLPVSRFVLAMQGGKKGLIVNSRNLCYKPKRNRARANIRGQNGRFSKTNPRVIAATCQKRRRAERKRAKRSSGRVSRASRAR